MGSMVIFLIMGNAGFYIINRRLNFKAPVPNLHKTPERLTFLPHGVLGTVMGHTSPNHDSNS